MKKWYEIKIVTSKAYVIEVEGGEDPYDVLVMATTDDLSNMVESETTELSESNLEAYQRHADEVLPIL